jgi:hypothetical protein
MQQRLALESDPLLKEETAECNEAAQRRQRAGPFLVADRVRKTQIETRDQEQHGERRGKLEQDRDAADQRRDAERELIPQAHHNADIRKQGIEVGACDVLEVFQQHGSRPERGFA